MSLPLFQRRVVVGVCGGIAAYKVVELVRLMVQAGAEVHVVMTRAATEFVGPLTFQTLSRNPVATSVFELDRESRMSHIELAEQADLLIVAPATANVLASFAHGHADDLLTTLHLVTRAPVLLAPAMNSNMWQHPLTQENLARLLRLGRVSVVGPEYGELAEGYSGVGRLAEPLTILQAAEACIGPHDWAGKRVLVSAGPTSEPIDGVRSVTNRSSGKMGFALARAARARGAGVTLVTGPNSLATPWGVERVDARTAAEMKSALIDRAAAMDAVFMAAAVADYRPATPQAGKMRKAKTAAMNLRLVRTDDILEQLARNRRGKRPLLVGFAAEWGIDAAALARKRVAKGCDVLIANDVSDPAAGFDADTNRVWVFGDEQAVEMARAPKIEVAHALLEHLQPQLQRAGRGRSSSRKKATKR